MVGKFGRHVRQQYAGFLALFIALGGVSYAAVQLSSGDVRSKHIKNGQVKKADIARNAVTSPKVMDRSLLPQDFAEGTLTAGPAGAQGVAGPQGVKGDPGANGATGATGLQGQQGAPGPLVTAEPWHEIAAAEFGACWTNSSAGAGRNTAGYYRDPFGRVHLKGWVRRLSGTGCGPVIFTLPPGYRPLGDENQLVSNGPIDTNTNTVATIVVVRSDAGIFSGQVTFSGGNQQDVFIDGISFRCAPSEQNGCP